MPYTPIVATLGYVLSPDRSQVLMIHRNARPGDLHLGKYNGLGGKIERDEDVVACMRREIREEAGIECDELHLAGTISWPGFGKGGEDWFGFLFRVTRFTGSPPAAIRSPMARTRSRRDPRIRSCSVTMPMSTSRCLKMRFSVSSVPRSSTSRGKRSHHASMSSSSAGGRS